MKILKDRYLKMIIIIFLILNALLFMRLLDKIYLPFETTSLEKTKQGAQAVIEYSEELAESYGVADKKNVKDNLARFKYEIEKEDDPEEVASLMVDYGRQIQDTIFRELQNRRINDVLNIINNQNLPDDGNITISNVEDKIKIADPENILNEQTIDELKDVTVQQTVEIKIKDSRAQITTPEDIFNQVDFLQTKVASLERQLNNIKEKSGYAEMSGSGIILNVYDRENNLEETGVVHSTDIRNIIDELLIAGAEGVEIGGQRVIATTAIRCVGPTVLVNNRPITVNPIVIKAIGDPEVLKSSLDIIKNQLGSFGIEFEVDTSEEIKLNAY